jgi:hypothetical protein
MIIFRKDIVSSLNTDTFTYSVGQPLHQQIPMVTLSFQIINTSRQNQVSPNMSLFAAANTLYKTVTRNYR